MNTLASPCWAVRWLVAIVVMLGWTSVIPTALGQTPPNDECVNASSIAGPGTFPFDLTSATQSPQPVLCSPSNLTHDVWLCWTSTCSGLVSVQTCGLTSADTVVVMYQGCACPPETLLACNDDCCGVQSSIQVNATIGASYLIRIGTASGAGVPGALRIECGDLRCVTTPPPPTPSPCTNPLETITLRTGQVAGQPGTPTQLDDSIVYVTSGDPVNCFSDSLNAGSGLPFAPAVASTNRASVISPTAGWTPSLDCDPQARWINWSSDPRFHNGGLPAHSVLYSQAFVVNAFVEQAFITFCWAVDDALGDPVPGPSPVGVYLQNPSGAITPLPALSGGGFSAQTGPITLAVPAGAISTGVNHLLVYQRDLHCYTSGLIYSATITVCGNCVTLFSAQFAGDPQQFNTDEQTGGNHPKEIHHWIGSTVMQDGLRVQFAQQVATNTRGLTGADSIAVGRANYDVNLRANFPPGDPWCLLVQTRRRGEITTVDDGNEYATGYISPVTGSLLTSPGQTATLAGGTLDLPTIFTNQTRFVGDHSLDFPFDQTATGIIQGVGPESMTLNFQWDVLVQSVAKPLPFPADGDSIGVRMGIHTPINSRICPGVLWYQRFADACTVRGPAPSANGCPSGQESDRCQTEDGHFVIVTCIPCVDSYCQSFTCDPEHPGCATNIDGWTTTGNISRPLFNPGSGGAGGGAGNGYLRLEDQLNGQPLALHTPAALHGKWDCFCGTLEFDIRIFDDGVAGSPNFFPSITIRRDESSTGANTGMVSPSGLSNVFATFVSTTPVNENAGWVHVRVPLPPGLQPAGSLGVWTFGPSSATPADRDWLRSRVTDVSFPADFTPGLDVIGYDNVCLTPNMSCLPPPSGLVGWWPFDEKTPAIHEIASRKPSHPEPTASSFGGAPGYSNSPAPIKGMVGGALQFDGVDDRVVSPASTSGGAYQFVTDDFTIDAWIKTTASSGDMPIVDKRIVYLNGSSPTGYRFFLRNGFLAFGLADLALPGESVYLSTTPNIADGAWHHVAVTVKRFTDASGPARVTLYSDCNIVGQFSSAGKTGYLANAQADLYIGGGHPIGGPATFFRGIIDEVEIFRRALPASEICAIYSAGCAGKCRDWCYTGSTCVSASGGPVTFTVYNGSPVAKTYTWAAASGGANPHCTINSGLSFSPATSSVTVPAYASAAVTFTVTLPPGFSASDLACFTITITDPLTGLTRHCEGTVGLCCAPPIKLSPSRAFLWALYGPGAPATSASFTLQNTGAGTTSVAYRVRARSSDPSAGEPIVRLDNLLPGAPLTGIVDIAPGQSVEVPVRIAYAQMQGFVPQELVIEIDPERDGVFVQTAVIGLIAQPFEPLCPDEFTDGFDTYTTGPVCGHGGWEEWSGSIDVCAAVTNEQGIDSDQSLKIIGTPGGSTGRGDDTVHRFNLVGGHWRLEAQTFVPAGAHGRGWIVLLNSYPTPLNWSVDISLDADRALVNDLFDAPHAVPIVTGQWTPIIVDIDLENDLVNAWYDSQQFIFNKSWINGDTGDGQPRIQALDLYAGEPTAGGITAMYFDAISFRRVIPCEPEDCNHNQIPDAVEIFEGLTPDANHNGIPDTCECPADWNHDGAVSSPDFFAFVSSFFAGNADFDGDGVTNTQDFFSFLSAFFTGC